MNRKFLSCALALSLMVSSLVGCASKPEATEPGTAAGEPVTLTIIHQMGEDSKKNALQEWCDTVTEQNPNYKFEIQAISDPMEAQELIQTKIATGDPADIIFGNISLRREIIQGGHIQILDDAPFMERYSEDVYAAASLDGHAYAIPVDIGLQMVYYNKDIFAEQGIEVPTTYDEYIAAGEKLSAAGINPFSYGFKDAWTAGVEFMFEWFQILSEDPDFFRNIDEGKTTYAESPLFISSLERMKQRVDMGEINPFGTDNSQSIQNFASGKAAMFSSATWNIATIRELNPEGNFGAFAMPTNEADGARMRMFIDDAFMISNKCKSLDAAYALFDFATSDAGANIWAGNTGLIPAVDGVELADCDEMTADAQKIIADGLVVNADMVYQPAGQPRTYLFNEFAAQYLYDDEKTTDEWIEILDTEYAAALGN